MNTKIEKYNKYLQNKKIAIIGLGVSNLPLIDYLSKLTDKLYIFNQSNLEEEIIKSIKKYNVTIITGDNYLEKLNNFDIIFRSPSCLPNNKYLLKAKEQGSIITTEVEEVIKLSPCKVIGITGSDGKTTTTTLISKLLLSLGYNVYTGGNIGTPLFTKLKDIKDSDIIVLELSSFQLMNMQVSPNISVITNISPNHLDIHTNYQEYIDAKKSIFLYQTKEDILVLNYDDKLVKDFNKEARGEVRYFSSKEKLKDSYYLNNNKIYYNNKLFLDIKELKIRGIHNYINICTSLNTIKDYIKDEDKLKKVLKEFTGVEHRIEYIREINKVKWYNDSASSTPTRTIAGINSFEENIILLAGGYDKNISYTPLAKPILDKVRVLILFGNTKDKIYEEVIKESKKENKYIEIYKLDTLKEVIDKAKEVAKENEIVLFSPASASFDMFKNAYQRGDIFKELVNKIQE